MLNISEMSRVIEFESFIHNKENVFIFPNADALSSHIIRSLLYRLENLEKKSYIFIEDSRKVLKKDIASGIYIEKDLGKKRAEVLSERYGGSFTTEVLNAFNNVELERYVGTVIQGLGNIFYINTNKETDMSEDKINHLVKETKGSEDVRKNFYGIEAFYNGKETVVTLVAGSNGELYGNNESILLRNVGYSLQEQYIRNSMTSQLVFNLVNSIVTEDMSFNYTLLKGDIQGGEIKRKYLKGRRKDSVITKMKLKDITTEDSLSYDFDDEYCKFRDDNTVKITFEIGKAIKSIGGVKKDSWDEYEKDAFGYLMLQKRLIKLKKGDDFEYKRYVLLMIDTIENNRNVYTEDLYTLSAYIERKIGGIYGA